MLDPSKIVPELRDAAAQLAELADKLRATALALDPTASAVEPAPVGRAHVALRQGSSGAMQLSRPCTCIIGVPHVDWAL